MDEIKTVLTTALITDVDEDDSARAGVVVLGTLQGDPDPDTARISVTIYENDPDEIVGGGIGEKGIGATADDEIEEVEIGGGGAVTWRRRFTIKARCLLENTKEELAEARGIASTLRSRMEKAILGMRFTGIATSDEYVSRGPISTDMRGETYQGGGPPDAYDFHIRIKFEVLTTQTVR